MLDVEVINILNMAFRNFQIKNTEEVQVMPDTGTSNVPCGTRVRWEQYRISTTIDDLQIDLPSEVNRL